MIQSQEPHAEERCGRSPSGLQLMQLRVEVRGVLDALMEAKYVTLVVPHEHSLPQAVIGDTEVTEAYRKLVAAVGEDIRNAGLSESDEACDALELSGEAAVAYFSFLKITGPFLPEPAIIL